MGVGRENNIKGTRVKLDLSPPLPYPDVVVVVVVVSLADVRFFV